MTRRPRWRLPGWKCAGMCWGCWFAGGVASGFLAGCVCTVGVVWLSVVGDGVGVGVVLVALSSSSAGRCSSPVVEDAFLDSSVSRGATRTVVFWAACGCACVCGMLCCARRWSCRSFVSPPVGCLAALCRLAASSTIERAIAAPPSSCSSAGLWRIVFAVLPCAVCACCCCTLRWRGWCCCCCCCCGW